MNPNVWLAGLLVPTVSLALACSSNDTDGTAVADGGTTAAQDDDLPTEGGAPDDDDDVPDDDIPDDDDVSTGEDAGDAAADDDAPDLDAGTETGAGPGLDAGPPEGFIGIEGGAIFRTDGVILVVGSDSIEPETVVTFERLAPPESTDELQFLSDTWVIGPPGLIFDPPARLTLPFDDIVAEGRPVAIYALDDTGEWIRLDDCEPHYLDVNCFLPGAGTVAVALLPTERERPDAGAMPDAGAPPDSVPDGGNATVTGDAGL